LLAEIPNIDRFDSEKAVAAFAGLSPQDRRSGTSMHGRPRLCKTGNSRLRKGFYMPALVAQRFNPTLRTFAERLLSADKHKQLVIGAVMRKLLALAFGILRSGVAFDANYA
jgi:transposase